MVLSSFVRHLLAIALALGLLLFAGHLLPSLLWETPPTTAMETAQLEEPEAPPPDLTPDSLLAHFGGHLNRSRRGVLPPGPPFPLYAYQITRYLDSLRCSVERCEEIGGVQLRLRYNCPPFPSRQIDLIKGGKLKSGAAQLSLVFETEGMKIATLNGLNNLSIPFALLIDPARADSTLELDIARLQPEAVVLRLNHQKIPRRTGRNPGDAIQPQLSEEEISNRIDHLFRRFPDAWGTLLTGQSKSFNYTHIAETLLQQLSKRGAQLLLTSDQSTALLDSACAHNTGTCLKAERSTSVEPEAITKVLERAAEEARRRGSKILVLPLTPETLSAVTQLKEEAERSGLEFLPLPAQNTDNRSSEGDRK